MTALQESIFTVIVPGAVTVYVPYVRNPMYELFAFHENVFYFYKVAPGRPRAFHEQHASDGEPGGFEQQ
jgi:hypothetical protein